MKKAMMNCALNNDQKETSVANIHNSTVTNHGSIGALPVCSSHCNTAVAQGKRKHRQRRSTTHLDHCPEGNGSDHKLAVMSNQITRSALSHCTHPSSSSSCVALHTHRGCTTLRMLVLFMHLALCIHSSGKCWADPGTKSGANKQSTSAASYASQSTFGTAANEIKIGTSSPSIVHAIDLVYLGPVRALEPNKKIVQVLNNQLLYSRLLIPTLLLECACVYHGDYTEQELLESFRTLLKDETKVSFPPEKMMLHRIFPLHCNQTKRQHFGKLACVNIASAVCFA